MLGNPTAGMLLFWMLLAKIIIVNEGAERTLRH